MVSEGHESVRIVLLLYYHPRHSLSFRDLFISVHSPSNWSGRLLHNYIVVILWAVSQSSIWCLLGLQPFPYSLRP